MSTKRPVYLDLLRLHLPLPGWVSILHRLSGLLLFALLPLGVWGLTVSLHSEHAFDALAALAASPRGRLAMIGVFAGFVFHLLAGLRHLAMDAHRGLERQAAQRSAQAVVAASLVAALLLALWLPG
ncbi:MAG: succinate dehydrogenase, cytochrome b556 subunit [Hydrogenophilales bacterium 16-64-46]|nr:MAG: succinate dehydrogenase, cytochrome b556 subunit [Hydrogenophilales bacterium 12-64-13]OYZ06196.1 MAG: succinate dehydrogenase, cytochrome b556 subunit [Hydrogenophilales bacterium 16-64-46]OZA38905.1 MAG: succinate dehydrogenase, cytochrome b556 subunit [Hydrogenophilales bacterium 17-64-34]HQS99445.1 succinate dehydrogenase, cytochrome b556 subunit [Thiobacillus sp.]